MKATSFLKVLTAAAVLAVPVLARQTQESKAKKAEPSATPQQMTKQEAKPKATPPASMEKQPTQKVEPTAMPQQMMKQEAKPKATPPASMEKQPTQKKESAVASDTTKTAKKPMAKKAQRMSKKKGAAK